MVSLSMGNAHNVVPNTNFGVTQRSQQSEKPGSLTIEGVG